MHKSQAKIDNMSTAEWQQYHQLLTNYRVLEYFAAEIERFSHTALKPDEVLRRFSLNGDGHLDVREFQLALKRVGILQVPPATDSPEQQQQMADALMKARELYSVFCPSQTKKLDIDLFCRIMTEWSLQLIRARHDMQRQSHQQQQQPSATSSSDADRKVRPSSSAGRRGADRSPFTRSDQFSAPGAVLSAPYATESSRNSTRGPLYGIPQSLNSSHGGGSSESEAIWRRISDAIVQNLDKLSRIFFKMDIACSGSVSREEFELGMSHIGVFLTAREYEKAYDSLSPELKDFALGSVGADDSTSGFGIKYADFLALFHGKSPLVFPTTSKHVSPPVAGMGSARLWDLLVQSIDKLQSLFVQLERINQRYVSPDTFRDCLARCGLAFSNADYAALRVRLLPFTDSATGAIGLAPLMQALRASDRSAMKTSAVASPIAMPSARAVDISPIRTGRRTNFQTAHDSYNPQLHPSVLASSAPHPAGKSNEQRNVEANRTIVKIRDESRWRSDCTLYGNPEAEPAAESQGGTSPQCDDPMFGSRSHVPLERRILAKLQQMKALGQLGSSSPQAIFPGDRFGRITRGQFRQSLVHLSVLARYAEVETIFWTLDPSGRGYIVNHDLYDHFNAFVARERSQECAPASPQSASGPAAVPGSAAAAPWSTLPAISTDKSSNSPTAGRPAAGTARLPRSAQKVLEGMLTELPHLLAICQRNDAEQTGMVSPQELLTAIQELGILASIADLQAAIFTVFSGMEEIVRAGGNRNSPPTAPYMRLEARLSQLCSDLLSPKKRKKHLSTTSVLLAPQEQPYEELIGGKDAFDMHTVSETDALWNCPRRRMNQDHRATKTSVRITDHISDDVGLVQTRLTQSAPKSTQQQQQQQHWEVESNSERRLRVDRVALIGILHDLLERRVDLKTAVDMHRSADIHGQVSKEDLAEILLTSRLGLNFSSSSSGISAREFVETLYPAHTPRASISYLDLLNRAGEVLAELKRVTPATAPGTQIGGGGAHHQQQQQQRQTARRLNSSVEFGLPSGAPSPRSLQRTFAMCGLGELSSNEASVRRKLLGESRLKDLLRSDSGRQSAAILVRHAFKGLAPREMVVPIENGEYEAMCRSSDVKHVCYRLGLDLDLSEQQFVAMGVDRDGSGFLSSPQLLDFFTQLALSAETPASARAAAASNVAPRVTKGGQFPGFDSARVETQPMPLSKDPRERSSSHGLAPGSRGRGQVRGSWSSVHAS